MTTKKEKKSKQYVLIKKRQPKFIMASIFFAALSVHQFVVVDLLSQGHIGFISLCIAIIYSAACVCTAIIYYFDKKNVKLMVKG